MTLGKFKISLFIRQKLNDNRCMNTQQTPIGPVQKTSPIKFSDKLAEAATSLSYYTALYVNTKNQQNLYQDFLHIRLVLMKVQAIYQVF